MRYADGNHRVPNVNCNSDGDFNWNLDNFENVWNDNNAFLPETSETMQTLILSNKMPDKPLFARRD